ncbi:hypothetical protein OGAPHI_003606 [Ogataea philodendri]|uniref:Uncharacterized protein n=1 Tax=Ogataea philodendri TaxID=1378263 RepID=A0A9P8P543_9ASCO|nr:uncharacterized protein OGAPHI_003606 [Ogataea philodendri]KAH3665422.1 hypothetical protein OGAPHI_003606 [Ogataea philodendri]
MDLSCNDCPLAVLTIGVALLDAAHSLKNFISSSATKLKMARKDFSAANLIGMIGSLTQRKTDGAMRSMYGRIEMSYLNRQTVLITTKDKRFESGELDGGAFMLTQSWVTSCSNAARESSSNSKSLSICNITLPQARTELSLI